MKQQIQAALIALLIALSVIQTQADDQPASSSDTSTAQTAAADKCCREGNLAFGKPTKASSQESGKNNFSRNAADGDLTTRWCAAGAQTGENWQVDLGKAEPVRSLRIHWEKAGVAYRYKVDASTDGTTWKTIADQSNNKRVGQIAAHVVDSPNTRFLRVTFLGSSGGQWGSFWEFEAYAGELPELPLIVKQANVPSAARVADVKVEPGETNQQFDVTIFGQPPEVNYPVCLAAAATGEVFVGVDEQGSLGKQPGRGKVLRCVDADGDGVADQTNVFVKIDHPRGLIYDAGSLWVLHPPFLSVHHDDDLDGVADRSETLITGISTDQVNRRGADHTTNGIRMGIDGWIYIAVGDFGFSEATAADGTKLGRRGGGIVRIRPDGSEMEIYNWGLRNILDVCIDPYMNAFTRDNTNDGGGWNVRLSHILQSAEYGYPSLYMNFREETMPPLADYGGGSGCGGMFFHDLRWPEPFGDALYTCDWGRSEVYRHNLPKNGATFGADQKVFLKIPRPTDIDVDGSGRMYVSSWKGGKFDFSGPNVGFVARITPKDFVAEPFPNLPATTDAQLIEHLAAPSAVYRLHSQRELLRRGTGDNRESMLLELAADSARPLYGRVAAIFTLKQLAGADSNTSLIKLADDSTVREFALRALTDRKSQLDDVPISLFLDALSDDNPRIRAQALISLGRIGDPVAGKAVLPLTRYTFASAPAHNQPDPQRVIPHLAVRSLVACAAVDACIEALNGPNAVGALMALRYMHDDAAVEGLILQLSKTRDLAARRAILATLIRLYHREGDYKGDWWGTRPDTSGPYYDRQLWSSSRRIGQVIRTAVLDADQQTVEYLRQVLARHKVTIPGLPNDAAVAEARKESQKPIEIPKADPGNRDQIANMPIENAAELTLNHAGRAERGQQLFTAQSCVACHTYADGQTPKGPHLVDIGKRYKRAELVESILNPNAKIAQGFDTYAFITIDGRIVNGFVVSESAEEVQIRQTNGVSVALKKADIDERIKQKLSMMPTGLANNLTPGQLADLVAYLESL